MRKIIVISMMSLDGVMQAPGGPDEDTSGGFQYGGWTASYSDSVSDAIMSELMKPADLLLGRKTFDIFESYWPQHSDNWPGINEVTKYVLSTTRNSSEWNNTEFLTTVEDIRKLKNSEGSDLKIWGSSKLIQLLLEHDLVDELWLINFPVVLGNGKKLFTDNAIAGAYTLIETKAAPCGVIFAHYKRAGDIVTGTVGE